MKKLIFVLLIIMALCSCWVQASAAEGYTVLEDFSDAENLTDSMSSQVDLTAYGLKSCTAEIRDGKLVLTPDYPSIFMSYCSFAYTQTALESWKTAEEVRFYVENGTNSDISVTLELFFDGGTGYGQPYVFGNKAYLIASDGSRPQPMFFQYNSYVAIPVGFKGWVCAPCTFTKSLDDSDAGFQCNTYSELTDFSGVRLDNIKNVRIDVRQYGATSGNIVLDDFRLYGDFENADDTPEQPTVKPTVFLPTAVPSPTATAVVASGGSFPWQIPAVVGAILCVAVIAFIIIKNGKKPERTER